MEKPRYNFSGNEDTILYGPPGGGKTTAVRIFAQTSSRVLISIDADQYTKQELLRKLFARAKQLGSVIIFFDEMDRVANKGSASQVASPHTKFLQTEMSGILANDITVIGATNWLDRFEPAVKSRFSSKILLPTLDATELNKPVKKILLKRITKYGAAVYFDKDLAAEMNEGATKLGHMTQGLDLRDIDAAIGYLVSDLRRVNPDFSGITYLRLQDVAFSFYIKKIEENIITNPGKVLTSTKYIRSNMISFFPSSVPLDSILASSVSVSLS